MHLNDPHENSFGLNSEKEWNHVFSQLPLIFHNECGLHRCPDDLGFLRVHPCALMLAKDFVDDSQYHGNCQYPCQ
jgi:hypothetical protein